MSVESHTEREAKLSAWPGFEVPDLSDVVENGTVERVTPVDLDAVYFDAEDLRLVRRGVTLRLRREGERAVWTLKLPASSSAPAVLARQEITVEDHSGVDAVSLSPVPQPPAELVRLVRAHLRSARLVPVARLHTSRRVCRVRDVEGELVVEIDDDEVSVISGDHVAARFREVEVEIGPTGSDEILAIVVGRLQAVGAGAADPTPKLVRALGPRALARPDLVAPTLGPDATIAEVVRAGFTNAVDLVLEHDHVVRLDDDIEGVHQARVGTRRLRSGLRTFGAVLDDAWAQSLRDELSWLADEFGEVRDGDVLLERFTRQVAALPDADDREAGAQLLSRLERRRDMARTRLLRHLDGRRYAVLLDHLVAAATDPQLTVPADRPARELLPSLVGRPWVKLRKSVARLGHDPADEDLHAIRILAKRARYAADVAVPVVGKPARDYVRALADLQDVLGEHHDAHVADSVLRSLAQSAPKAQVLVAGQLIGIQRAEGAARRAEFPAAWRKVDRKKLTEWMA